MFNGGPQQGEVHPGSVKRDGASRYQAVGQCYGVSK